MKKNLFTRILALALILILCTVPALAAENPVSDSRNGVVRVMAVYDNDYFYGSSYGTAFGVGEKAGEETLYFVTNKHVITDMETGIRCNQAYILLDDYAVTHMGFDSSRAVPCELFYVDPVIDIAILKVSQAIEGRVALPLFDPTEEMTANDTVIAIGYPGSADYITMEVDDVSGVVYYDTPASPERVTFTNGILSSFTVNNLGGNGARCLQHTAPINHGNSGGPLVNEKGGVIGVNTWSFGTGEDGETYHHYSINISEVIDILEQEHIPYDTLHADLTWLFIVLAIVVVAAAAAVIVLKTRKPQPQAAPVAAAPVIATAPQPAARPSVPDGGSGLRFQAVSGVFSGKRFAINGTIRIGRDPQNNDFVYPAETKGISSRHCSLTYANGKLYLKDEGSSYGTFLAGGQRLAGGQSVELKIGDQFYLATTNETFVITGKGGM